MRALAIVHKSTGTRCLREFYPMRFLWPRHKNQEIFFIEYGHDGYQKNPLSMQIPEKSTYSYPKQHILKQKWLSLLQEPYCKLFIKFFA
jgi:hypothetical protein